MMVGEVGYDLRIMTIFEKYGISYILKSTNANSITMVINDKPKAQDLIKELDRTFYKVTVKKVALVCCMGTNIAHPGFCTRLPKLCVTMELILKVSHSLFVR